jgi:hypothetical protein
MRKHHTKNKGDLGVLKCQADLMEKGFLPCVPCSEHSNFDLVAYQSGGKFYRIQVKYREIKNGKVEVSFKSSWADKNGIHEQKWDKQEIDLVCVFCPDTNKCYYFDPNNYGKSLALRFDKPKHNLSRVHFASDFETIP